MVLFLQQGPELPHQSRFTNARFPRYKNEIFSGILPLHPVFLDALINAIQLFLTAHEDLLLLYRMLCYLLAQLQDLVHQRPGFRLRLLLQILLQRQCKLLIE